MADTATVETEVEQQIVVRTKDVRKIYRMGKVEVHALKGITLEIRTGEYVSIMGPSGSGKTTLFNMVGALDKPSSGQVYIDEVDVAQLDAYELAWLRCRKIGYIFQTFNLIPVMSALENPTSNNNKRARRLAHERKQHDSGNRRGSRLRQVF